MFRARRRAIANNPQDEPGAYAGTPGPGVGTLPSGSRYYRRPPERILDDIHQRLDAEPVDAQDVTVRVDGGDVVLEGTVPHHYDCFLIERACDDVLGVVRVDNRIQVRSADVRDGEEPLSEPLSETHWTPLG